jgi:hypothetical protein
MKLWMILFGLWLAASLGAYLWLRPSAQAPATPPAKAIEVPLEKKTQLPPVTDGEALQEVEVDIERKPKERP